MPELPSTSKSKRLENKPKLINVDNHDLRQRDFEFCWRYEMGITSSRTNRYVQLCRRLCLWHSSRRPHAFFSVIHLFILVSRFQRKVSRFYSSYKRWSKGDEFQALSYGNCNPFIIFWLLTWEIGLWWLRCYPAMTMGLSASTLLLETLLFELLGFLPRFFLFFFSDCRVCWHISIQWFSFRCAFSIGLLSGCSSTRACGTRYDDNGNK